MCFQRGVLYVEVSDVSSRKMEPFAVAQRSTTDCVLLFCSFEKFGFFLLVFFISRSGHVELERNTKRVFCSEEHSNGE